MNTGYASLTLFRGDAWITTARGLPSTGLAAELRKAPPASCALSGRTVSGAGDYHILWSTTARYHNNLMAIAVHSFGLCPKRFGVSVTV